MPNDKRVLTFDPKTGGTTLDLHAAEATQIREFQAAMRDLERMGMEQSRDQNIATPRALIRAQPNVPDGNPGQGFGRMPLPAGAEPYREIIEQHLGLGDIHSQVTSPGERYWESWRSPHAPVGGMSGPYARRRKKAEIGQISNIFVQQPTWIAPPVTAISIDVFTPASGVMLTGSYPGPGACVDVLSIDVPDRFILIVDRFGNELEDHDSFGDVRFSMQRNETPIRSYGDFDVQLGRFDNPTKFGSPLILKHKDRFRLKAQALNNVDHIAYARLIGWAFAVKQTSGDGSHTEYLVQ
jgi:hypothetical protein